MSMDSSTTDSCLASEPSTSSSHSNNDIRIEGSVNSTVSTAIGNDNTINQGVTTVQTHAFKSKIMSNDTLADLPAKKFKLTNETSASSRPLGTYISTDGITNSNISTIIGSHNTVNQGIVKTPAERIEYNIQGPNQSFTGRERVIQELHEAIEGNRKTGDLTILSQNKVISGLGGIGKTETVRKYLQEYKNVYGHALWINAETHARAKDCLISIATLTNVICFENIDGKRKKDDEIAAEVYNFICQKPAIIVFDNANSLLDEDGEEGIGILLPRALHTHCVKPAIVLTSRNIKWSQCQVIKMSGFEDNESYRLLINQLKFMDTPENRSLAAEISNLCDGLPLVIQQVIGVIKSESEELESIGEDVYSMQDFIQDYHKGSKSYINESPFDVPAELGFSHTVYQIFKLTFQKIEEKKGGRLAMHCINIVSMLSPDCIPVELLLSFFDADSKKGVPQALGLLRKYNILNLVGKCYSVHRMVQKVGIEILRQGFQPVRSTDGELKHHIVSCCNSFFDYLSNATFDHQLRFEILENGMRFVDIIFKEGCGNDTFEFLIALVDSFIEYGKYYNATRILESLLKNNITDTACFDKCRNKLAKSYSLEGKLLASEQLYNEVLNSYIIDLGPDHPSVLTTKHSLAGVYANQGKYNDAEALYNEVLKYEMDVPGPNHLAILTTKNCLAGVFVDQGKYDEAVALYNEVLKSQMIALGSNHQSVLTTKTNLAEVVVKQGKYDDAEALYNEVLKSGVIVLGPDHPSILTTKLNIAGVYVDQGKYDDADTLLNKVLKRQMIVFGPDHPSILTTKHSLARVYVKQGKYKDAEALYNEVLKSYVIVLGGDHPSALASKHSLAGVYVNQGKYHDAEALFNEVLKTKMVVLGREHPSVLATKHNLAGVLVQQGKYDDAEALFNEVLKSQMVVLGPEHPFILTTKHNLAGVYVDLGKYDEAQALFNEVLKTRITVLGPDHPSVLETKHSLANVFTNRGKYDDAEVIYGEVLKSGVIVLGPDHLSMLTTKHNLASVYVQQRKYNDAEALFNDVLKSQITVLGPDHPSVLTTKQSLAGVYIEQGEYDDAEALNNEV